jgi:hypothetical protein
MRIVDQKRISLIALAIIAMTSLSACASESKANYDDLTEPDAQKTLTADFAVPYYPDSTLFETSKSGSSTTASFHSTDATDAISDWYSRRLRMLDWVVTNVEKESSMCEVVANKGKDECKLKATNNGSQSTIVITYTKK